MIRVTIDTNILLTALNANEADHLLAIELINMHKERLIDLKVVAANASENGRTMTGENRALIQELEQLGLDEDRISPVGAIVGMSFIGHTYVADLSTEALRKNIWKVLFPYDPFEHDLFCARRGIPIGDAVDYIDPTWRNYMCDTLTVAEYINSSRDNPSDDNILLSGDKDDIVRKASKLAALGAPQIYDLKNGLTYLRTILNSKGN